jgi:CheY-like chemotaxis protein/AraC-like DNA-binding protein
MARERPVILAVDDDEVALDSFRVILEPEYEVLTARSGPAALKILHSRPFEAVLLDLFIPRMDGLEVLTRIKQADPRVEVILVSGLAQTQAVVTGIKLGAFEYLMKPFAEEDLLGLLAEVINRRRADPGTVLLVGADLGVLASFAVLLSPYVTVATVAPQLSGLPDPVARTPLVVIYDCGVTPYAPPDFVDRLSERYWRSTLVLLMTEGYDISRTVRSRGTVVRKPYRFDDVLHGITALVSGLEDLSVRAARFGSHLLRLIDVVIQSYREPLGTRELALAVGCSVHHLAHIVRERFGMPLIGYLRSFRFEVARHLLTVTNRSIDEIASDAGFSSASHLSRVFLQNTGYRPGDYRRQVRMVGMWPPRLKPQFSSAVVAGHPAEAGSVTSWSASPAVRRARVRERLRAGRLPRHLPPQLGIARGRFASRRRSGVSEGTRCAGCDEAIKQGDLMCDYTYPSGDVIAFHDECDRIWDEERTRESNT